MKKLILIFLFIAEFHFTQDFDQRNYLSSNQIKDKIYQNLEKLELQFLRKLNNNDYLKAKEIIFDSYLLLFSIPDFEFDDYLIMSEQDFKQLVSDLKNESFTEDKLTIIELVSNSNNFTVSQVYQILETIDFSEDRIEAIELLYPSIVDKYNSYRLLSLFNNSTDKQTVRNIISNYNYLRR
ncbi:MAG: DUF4476 domain-containing protein [Ignavibacterium sp.]|nr:DUF4476 domain-containing protein [Ignavibacterium sp.]MDW8374801.1 DUF4476 domain-containing protein [Ignavibacteriales bacterium]